MSTLFLLALALPALAAPADVDCNGVTTLDDIAALVVALFSATTCANADVNQDGRLSAADLPAALVVLGSSSILTATPTPSATPSPTQTPTVSSTPTLTPTSSSTATHTDTATPTATISPTHTDTATSSPTLTPTATFTLTATATGSASPTASATSTPTQTLTSTPTWTSSASPTLSATPTATTATGNDGTGAFVATLGDNGTANFYFGGTVLPAAWTTIQNLASCDFRMVIDQAPGVRKSWTATLEYATLAITQTCADITNWTTVPLCTLSDSAKGCGIDDVSVDIVGPACVRGHVVGNGDPATRVGGTASLHCYDSTGGGLTHFQGTGGATATTAFFGGNVFRSTNTDRTYFPSSGVTLRRCGGVVALTAAPGSDRTWHVNVATSTTALSAGQNCADLAYTTTADLCTITGTNQKSCSWQPATMTVADGGCVQVRGTCTGGTCAATTNGNFSLDCTSGTSAGSTAGAAAYSSAGSGAFDAKHSFQTGQWAISDSGFATTISQRYWLAPPRGLSACAGALTMDQPIGGSGSFQMGLRRSTTTPTATQSCVDLSYTDVTGLCTMAAGQQSCVFPLTAFDVAGSSCFALVTTQTGSPTAGGNPFNWQAYCLEASP